MKKAKKRKLRWDRLLILLAALCLILVSVASSLIWASGRFNKKPAADHQQTTQPAENNEPAPAPEPESHKALITVTGDILLEDPLLNYFGNGTWLNYVDNLYPWFKQDDLTIANMEVPIGGEELGITGINFSFNSPDQTAQNVKDSGIEFVSLANNHAMDRGMEGIVKTHANLDAAGVGYTGTFLSQKDRDTIKTVDVNGIKIAFVSWTYSCNQPIDEPWAVNAFYNAWSEQSSLLLDDVKRADEQADAVIVSIHWGTEFTYALNEDQTILSQAIADAGADVIIGNHPHTIQPAQWLQAADGRQVLCFYSLGNLMASAYMVDRADEQFQNMYEAGAIGQFELVSSGNSISINDVAIIPFVNHFEGEYENFSLIPLKDYTEELAAAHSQRRFSELFTLEWLKDQVHQVFDSSGFTLVMD